MRLLRQPADSTICGQCSVAMISDKTTEEIIALHGGSHPMNLSTFREALEELRIDYEVKFFEGDAGHFEAYQGRGILRVAMAEDKYGMGHAVAFENGKIYDPMNCLPFDNVVDMCMAYLKVTGEVWIVDFAITTKYEGMDENETS